MSRQLSTTRPFVRRWGTRHPVTQVTPGGSRPCSGPGPLMAPWFKPEETGAGFVYAGMDPSDPSTYVRAWRPQPGMIAYLNFDGAQTQGNTEMGGLWGAPAWADIPVGGRPARRSR